MQSQARAGTKEVIHLLLLGHSMSDQRVFCNDLLRFALNLACLLSFNILTNMQMLSYVKALPHVTISSTFHRRRWNIVDIVDDEPATRNDNVNDADVK